jgi:phosphopantetheinyl transferase
MEISDKIRQHKPKLQKKPMPLHSHTILNEGHTSLWVWQILETEQWFRSHLPDMTVPGHPKRRLQHLAGRFLLSQADAEFPFHDIRITDHGRPYLEHGGMYFSISHSADMAAVILSRNHHVGVDLELITPRVLKVAPRFLGVTERQWINESIGSMDFTSVNLNHQASMSLCTLLWSAKEAAYKWLGIPGLDFATDLEIEAFNPEQSGYIKTRCRKEGDFSFRIGYQSLDQGWLTWVNEPLSIHHPDIRDVG